MAKSKKTEAALTLEEKLEQTLVADWEQPYKVPANWSWCKLPALCEYIKAGGDKPKVFSDEKTSALTVPVVANGISNDGIVGFTSEAVEKAGSITVSGRGTIGFSVIRDYPYYPIVRLIVIRPNRTVLAGYIKYAFDHFIEQGTGTSIPQLTVPMLKDKFIPVPPLAEQQRIVDRIERMFLKLDEVKENVQNVIYGFENRKSAILHKAFNGELTAKWRAENGVDVSKWKKRNLQSVCSMKITDGTHKTPKYCDANNGIPFISAKDVASGKISWENIKYIIPELHEELYERLAPQLDDVLLAKNGTTGIAAIVDVEKIFDIYVTLAVLRPDKEIINPYYLLNVVNSPICKKQFDAHLTGIGVPNLHLRDIKEVIIPLPSLPEQTEIVCIVNELLSKEQQAKEKAEEVLERIELIKKSILARAFRGELGTNNPDEESSIELLKTVLSEDKNEKRVTKPKSKRVSIPVEVKAMLSNHLEKDILKLFYKAESNEVSIDDIMSVSSNKFEIMDALKALEEKKLVSKKANGIYKLAR
ncbi:MAG: hypothetical protein HFE52_08845 [Clostridia bacterium]|nr:hypothetical protein [Clostridia bacterium]